MYKELYFAAGCFWGARHFFADVDGVSEAVCGYANGQSDSPPSYEEVYTDMTGFAETVRVKYNPGKINPETLVRLFFTIIDPLSLNRQGEDSGTRYRTGVYYTSAEDIPLIEAVFKAMEAKFGAPLAVELLPLNNFFLAEERHQNYLEKHPEGYCHIPLKSFRYLRLWQDVRLFLGDEEDPVARMANMAALIHGRMKFFWTGFYRVTGKQLVLGPFQGPEACFRIGYGKGVCGSAWKEGKTLVVPDVEEFPGHIACSSESKSEIVVPVIQNGEVVAVLDIDSQFIGNFDQTDAAFLEMIAEVL